MQQCMPQELVKVMNKLMNKNSTIYQRWTIVNTNIHTQLHTSEHENGSEATTQNSKLKNVRHKAQTALTRCAYTNYINNCLEYK